MIVKVLWQLFFEDFECGIVKGFKLFYNKKGVVGLIIEIIVNGLEIYIYYVIGFDKNKEYEFQLLVFFLVGDGLKSFLKVMGIMDNGKD